MFDFYNLPLAHLNAEIMLCTTKDELTNLIYFLSKQFVEKSFCMKNVSFAKTQQLFLKMQSRTLTCLIKTVTIQINPLLFTQNVLFFIFVLKFQNSAMLAHKAWHAHNSYFFFFFYARAYSISLITCFYKFYRNVQLPLTHFEGKFKNFCNKQTMPKLLQYNIEKV